MALNVYLVAAVLSVFSLMTVKEIIFPTNVQASNPDKMDRLQKAAAFTGPTIKFLYWKAFEEYAQFIHQNFPMVRIEGDNYPPPRPRQMLASVLSIAKLAVMAIVLLGERLQIWESLNIDPPQAYIWATQNKMYACILIFFVTNMIEGQLISTGAFEVSLNDMPIWSKLESGRLPNPNELHQIIENQLKFSPSH